LELGELINKSLTEQIECVRREIGFRKRVYQRQVACRKMTKEQMDHEIDCMESVLETLVKISEQDFSLG
jgi:hypothetical protein